LQSFNVHPAAHRTKGDTMQTAASDPQPTEIPDVFDDPEEDALIEADIQASRAQFALALSRFFLLANLTALVSVVALWLLSQQPAQLLVFALLVLVTSVGNGLALMLYRRKRVILGHYALLLPFILIPAAVPLVVPAVTSPVVLLLAIDILLSYLLFGDRGSLWLIGIAALALIGDIVLAVAWEPDWFTSPLDQNIQVLIGLGLGVVAVAAFVFAVRMTVLGQESATRLALRSNLEIERRMHGEHQQRLQLQAAYDQIEERVAGERMQYQRLQLLLGQVRTAITQFNATAAELQAATSQQLARSHDQDAAITQTAATVEKIWAAVASSADKARSVADDARQSVEVSRTGLQAVADTVDGMHLIRERVENIAETILALSERTQQIGDIIQAVSAISDRSKLLALNASIEAARAGEEGKGFSVVAMEVRKLAEQSREATARVSDLLGEIQRDTNTAVMVTEEGSKVAEAGIDQVVRTGEVIHELATTIEHSADAARQIADESHRQITSMDQLTEAMMQIRKASRQAAGTARQTEESIGKLVAMARELEESAASYQT
jgi:methyl-accepting chemotaxis protein